MSSVPDHPRGHTQWGAVYLYTKRASQGISQLGHALALDRNLAGAHGFVGFGKILIGRPEETEAHIADALRLSPRDPLTYVWLNYVGMAKNLLGLYEEAVVWRRRSIEADRNFPLAFFSLAASFALLGRLDESRPAAEAGLALDPTYTVSRAQAIWEAMTDHPTTLARQKPVLEGMRTAGVPE